jgi:hypothetical protein
MPAAFEICKETPMSKGDGAVVRRLRRGHALFIGLVVAALGGVVVLGSTTTTAAKMVPVESPGTIEQTQQMVELFKARFQTIGPELAENLDQLYAADIRFRDPISTATGLAELRAYFLRFAEASHGARFEITDEVVQAGQAAIFWTMTMIDEDGKPDRRFGGVSHLKVNDRIFEERDYFDLGEAVYDHVPVLNWFTSMVRSHLD